MMPSRRQAYRVAPFVLLALLVLVVPLPDTTTPVERHITLDATQFEFAPGRVQVSQGDHVTITLVASDVVHGFYLDGYGIEERVEPGLTKQIEFVADRTGKFRYRCSVTCGPLHPFIVERSLSRSRASTSEHGTASKRGIPLTR